MNATECRREYGEAHDAHMALNGECPWCLEYDEAQMDPNADVCPKCGQPVQVVSRRSTPGFTGASIYVTEYSCGHTDVDASGDNLEAVR